MTLVSVHALTAQISNLSQVWTTSYSLQPRQGGNKRRLGKKRDSPDKDTGDKPEQEDYLKPVNPFAVAPCPLLRDV